MLRARAWWAAFTLPLVGAILWILGAPRLAVALLALAWTALATLALVDASTVRGGAGSPAWGFLGAMGVVGTSIAAFLPLPPAWQAGAAALGAQVVLLVIARDVSEDARRWSRLVLPVAGHLAVLAGSAVLIFRGYTASHVATLALGAGFGVLVLHAHWMRRSGTMGRGTVAREPLVLASLLLLAGGAMVRYIGLATRIPKDAALVVSASGEGLMMVGAFCALAMLAGPPARVLALVRAREGTGIRNALGHAAATLTILNVFFVAFSLVATWSARMILVALTAYVVLAVGMEYRALRDAMRSRRELRRDVPPPPGDDPVTLVISARDEARTLHESLPRNLRLPQNVRIILLPSERSADDTVELCEAAARSHPRRVTVVRGTAGDKAGDLNLAWREIETEYVLMLDADEVIDEASLRHGLARLRGDPRLAIVQGRKASRAPESGPLARFIATERRHSTTLDQTMHANLGSAHFAGSAALLRRDAIPQSGGWTSETLTEDIELTMRLHLRTNWRISYEPRMLVREADPASIEALLRQRTRWSRGWMQCFSAFFDEVVRRRRELGGRRAWGLAWLLLAAVSAPIMAILPALVLLRALGIPALLPWAVGIAVASFVLPARLLGYGYSALFDPAIPVPRRVVRLLELMFHAYAWILFSWVVHFHALYLEISSAPRLWYVTAKAPAAPTPARKGVSA